VDDARPVPISRSLAHTYLSSAFRCTQLYRFLARRTNSKFNKLVLHRLCMSRVNRPPVSTSKLAVNLANKKEGTIGVVVGTVTDDTRLLDVPKLRVAALHFTAGARARILKAGGEALTFDQLALRSPTGANTVLLRGRKTARTATKYFGAAGVPGSSTRYVSRARWLVPCPCPSRCHRRCVLDVFVVCRIAILTSCTTTIVCLLRLLCLDTQPSRTSRGPQVRACSRSPKELRLQGVTRLSITIDAINQRFPKTPNPPPYHYHQVCGRSIDRERVLYLYLLDHTTLHYCTVRAVCSLVATAGASRCSADRERRLENARHLIGRHCQPAPAVALRNQVLVVAKHLCHLLG